jgi:redox-sensitive bicupin YhaK (pirin superfamily)
MNRRQFMKGSAIVGMSVVGIPLFAKDSGMFSVQGSRKIYRILSANSVNVGTLPVMRAFAGGQTDFVSPYVMLDEFGPVALEAGSDPLRVDAHPHAGVTPTTYFLEGTGHHKDSLNYDFQIGKGDFMLFSSGRGAIHMEESGHQLYKEGGKYHGFQIWLNTPAKYKFAAPSTAVYRLPQMDTIETDNYHVKVVLGDLFDARSNIELQHPAFYYHLKLKPDGRIDIPTNPNHNAFLYLIRGEMELQGGRKLLPHQLALFHRGESLINLYAQEGAECLVLGGQPLNEPVFSYGPFVMNNEAQIRQCMRNYQAGLMGNPELVNR